ncbi:MAG TPA: hypothetical protein VG538_11445 [Vicinamibacterales bacterium]|nr:hypothetical protein [Vicinamibacterales bacterium]
MPQSITGLIVPGNIDVTQQPQVRNSDGTISTVDSISIDVGGHEVLIPRVTPDGRHLTTPQAIEEYQRTGRNLGTFKDIPSADAYGEALHESEARRIMADQTTSPTQQTYRFKMPNGRFVRITGEQPPSDADQQAIFKEVGGAQSSHGAAPAPTPDATATAQSWADRAIDSLPMVGGMAGGLIGGSAGAAAGGIGAVPGAVVGAGLGGATGESSRELIQWLRGQPVPETAIDRAKAIAGQGAMNAGIEVAGAPLAAVGRAIAPRLMQSALKPGVRAIAADVHAGLPVPTVVETLLKEGVNVSESGVQKLNRLLTATNQDITDALNAVPSRVRIKPRAVATRVDAVADEFGQQVNPRADLDRIQGARQEFLEAHAGAGQRDASGRLLPERTLSVQDAQSLKQGTYRQIGNKYGMLAPADIEAQKALARGLKEEIAAETAKAGYDINTLNAREGALLDAKEAVAHRVAVSKNANPIGFAWVTSHPLTFLASLIDRNSGVKSLLARGLYGQAGRMAKANPQLIRAAVLAIAGIPDEPMASHAVATPTAVGVRP